MISAEQRDALRLVPRLIVFDLDMCTWSPEMYTLSHVPDHDDSHERGDLAGELGVTGVRSGRAMIRLFPGALHALQAHWRGDYGEGVRFAAASSADTPLAVRIGRRAMEILEVLPGVTLRQAFDKGWPDGFEGHLQIGRTPPLRYSTSPRCLKDPDKAATHFPLLRKHTGVDFVDMLFFDDSNWGDHVGQLERVHGVVGVRTPDGMQVEEFERGLALFHKRRVGVSGGV